MATGCSDVETVENKGRKRGASRTVHPVRKTTSPNTGFTLSYHPNGKVHEERNYKEDVLHGESKVYYENGALDYIETPQGGAIRRALSKIF